MTRDEAKVLNREFYRFEGSSRVTAPVAPDGWWCSGVTVRMFPGVVGYGCHKTDYLIAQGLAWRNLKRKVFIV